MKDFWMYLKSLQIVLIIFFWQQNAKMLFILISLWFRLNSQIWTWQYKNFYFKGYFNCITELLARDEKWKYYINLTADDFPVKTSIEITSNLKELYPNSWTLSTPNNQPGWPERYEYVHNVTKNLSPNQWIDTPFQMKNTGFWSQVLETKWSQQTC